MTLAFHYTAGSVSVATSIRAADVEEIKWHRQYRPRSCFARVRGWAGQEVEAYGCDPILRQGRGAVHGFLYGPLGIQGRASGGAGVRQGCQGRPHAMAQWPTEFGCSPDAGRASAGARRLESARHLNQRLAGAVRTQEKESGAA